MPLGGGDDGEDRDGGFGDPSCCPHGPRQAKQDEDYANTVSQLAGFSPAVDSIRILFLHGPHPHWNHHAPVS